MLFSDEGGVLTVVGCLMVGCSSILMLNVDTKYFSASAGNEHSELAIA